MYIFVDVHNYLRTEGTETSNVSSTNVKD